MFPMRLIFLVVATSLICHDITLGEDPNEDRIGAILSAITKINTNVEDLAVKVDGMEKKVNGIDAKVEKVDNDVKFFSTSVWKFVVRELKDHTMLKSSKVTSQ